MSLSCIEHLFQQFKADTRLYIFFSGVLCSSSSISVMQLGNRAAMRFMFYAAIFGDSTRSLSIRFILFRCKFAKVANRIFQKFFLCCGWKLIEALLCLFISVHKQVCSTSCRWRVLAFCESCKFNNPAYRKCSATLSNLEPIKK